MRKRITSFAPFAFRFTAVHVATYVICGILFMLVSGYFDYFAADPLMSVVMRPADDFMVALAIPGQLIRGLILAFAVYPFRITILEKPIGWLKLFSLLFILTNIGAVVPGPGSIEGFFYTYFDFSNPLIGTPEITVQMLAFSWLFCLWQRKYYDPVDLKWRSPKMKNA
jgi:hypothetical protein